MFNDSFLPLCAFALVTSITPGPNNLMIMASAANFGIYRSLRHLVGITAGFMVMLMMVGNGLSQVFDAFPVSYLVLKGLSVAYLLFLAWKIANAAPPQQAASGGRPFGFVQAALFQWVNPKAWAMALTATTAYAPSQSLMGIAFVTVVFGAINLPCVGSWAILGQQMRKLLTNPMRLRMFNWLMAVLLITSLVPVLVS